MNTQSVHATTEVASVHRRSFADLTPFCDEPGFLKLLSRAEVEDLRQHLLAGEVPPDLKAKLHRLSDEGDPNHGLESYARLFLELLAAERQGAFEDVAPSDCEWILRVLAYIRKEDDAVPDFLAGGYWDDRQELRAAINRLNHLLDRFKAWRLRAHVPSTGNAGQKQHRQTG